ncbi:MAG: PASTA domain-containing protein, partial [Oscillospiraceae bacterium]
SVALKQIQLEAPCVTTIDASIPQGLNEIISRTMEKEPEKRFQTADEMLEAINAFKNNPNAVFEYKYLQNNELQEEKYKTAIKKARQEDGTKDKNRYVGKAGGPTSMRQKRQEPEYEEEDTGKAVIMVLGGITTAFVIISMVFIFTMLFLNNPLEKVPDVKAPDLVGLKFDLVKSAPEYKNFEIVAQDSRFNELHPKGEIIEQSPKSGKTVKVNSVIKVIVSKGAQIVAVPNVIGYEETLAYHEIDGVGLNYEKVEIFSFDGAGTVVATEPGAGSEVNSGTTIKLIISMGPENTIATVPNVVNTTLEKGRKLLEDKGLKIGGISYVISEEPYETIIAQDPAQGAQIAVGGFINVVVSGGEEHLENRVTAEIPLPEDVKEEVKLTARYQDTTLKEETVIPSEAKRWRPVFEGKGQVTVHILYNDFLFMTIDIDFSKGSWQITEDNSEAFK